MLKENVSHLPKESFNLFSLSKTDFSSQNIFSGFILNLALMCIFFPYENKAFWWTKHLKIDLQKIINIHYFLNLLINNHLICFAFDSVKKWSFRDFSVQTFLGCLSDCKLPLTFIFTTSCMTDRSQMKLLLAVLIWTTKQLELWSTTSWLKTSGECTVWRREQEERELLGLNFLFLKC